DVLLVVFFFQAEDGIRDFHVTGVRTCALPIWAAEPTERDAGPHTRVVVGVGVPPPGPAAAFELDGAGGDDVDPHAPGCQRPGQEIGRASCREREVLSGRGVSGSVLRTTEVAAK